MVDKQFWRNLKTPLVDSSNLHSLLLHYSPKRVPLGTGTNNSLAPDQHPDDTGLNKTKAESSSRLPAIQKQQWMSRVQARESFLIGLWSQQFYEIGPFREEKTFQSARGQQSGGVRVVIVVVFLLSLPICKTRSNSNAI